MVTEGKAFYAEDGSVHKTHGEAARYDAELKLKSLDVFRPETILAIINNGPAIIEALNSLLDEPTEA